MGAPPSQHASDARKFDVIDGATTMLLVCSARAAAVWLYHGPCARKPCWR
jgi:hypothetical protein